MPYLPPAVGDAARPKSLWFAQRWLLVLAGGLTASWADELPHPTPDAPPQAEARQADERPPTYQDDVKPILRQYCLKCHGNDEQNADLNLQTYATLLQGGSAGAVVKPGKPEASILFQAITAEDEAARMPPQSPPLPADRVAMIRRWIASGLRETRRSKSLAGQTTVTFQPPDDSARRPSEPLPLPTKLPDWQPPATARRLPVLALAANPWSPLLAVGDYQQIRLIDLTNQQEIGALPFPEGTPHVLQFSRNGSVLLAAGGKPVQSGSVVLFNPLDGQRLAQLGDELDAVLAADLAPDQRTIALGGSGRVVKAYATTDGKLRFRLTKHTDWITAIAFSPDGKQLATGDRAGGIHLWDAASGGILLSLSSHKGAVRTLVWRSDSKLLVSGGDDGRLIWWNAENGFASITKVSAHNPQRPAGVFGKLPNGVLAAAFASDGWLFTVGRDRHGRLWDTQGTQRRTFALPATIPTQAAIGFDGRTLIAGDSLGQLHYWQRP